MMHTADKPAPTPSAAATLYATARVVKIKGDEYVASEIEQAANEIVKLERELSSARAEAERLREALVKLKAAYITARSGQEMTDEEISLAATVNHALAATRKDSDG